MMTGGVGMSAKSSTTTPTKPGCDETAPQPVELTRTSPATAAALTTRRTRLVLTFL
jgi:hypothetical protein